MKTYIHEYRLQSSPTYKSNAAYFTPDNKYLAMYGELRPLLFAYTTTDLGFSHTGWGSKNRKDDYHAGWTRTLKCIAWTRESERYLLDLARNNAGMWHYEHNDRSHSPTQVERIWFIIGRIYLVSYKHAEQEIHGGNSVDRVLTCKHKERRSTLGWKQYWKIKNGLGKWKIPKHKRERQGEECRFTQILRHGMD